MALMAHLCGLLRAILGVNPNAFDADLQTVEGAFVDVTRASRGDGLATNGENRRRKSVRGWQCRPVATHSSELA